MDEEKLIHLVSGYPELYNLENPNYMNHVRKNNIWNEIGALLGVSDTVCREKWKALRDAYHRCIKRRKSKSGDAAKKIKKWRFEEQMEFLLPYFQERNSKSNITDANISDDDQVSSHSGSVFINSPSPTRSTSTPNREPDSLRTSSRSTVIPDLSRPGPSASNVFETMTARKKNKQPQSQVANVLHQYLDSRKETISPVHSFFKAMADSVANLSPDLQLQVKNEVYLSVSQAELKNLNRIPKSSLSTGSITPNRNIYRQQQKKPKICVLQNVTNAETQNILQPPQANPTNIVLLNENEANTETQYILQPSESILQPQPLARYRYYINDNGEICFDNETDKENYINDKIDQ